jgi:hypothetical protein
MPVAVNGDGAAVALPDAEAPPSDSYILQAPHPDADTVPSAEALSHNGGASYAAGLEGSDTPKTLPQASRQPRPSLIERFGLLLRPRRKRPGAASAAVAAGAARALAPVPTDEEQPVEAPPTARARRAMKPLPWGRDFAAATIQRDDTLTAVFGKLDAADSPRVALLAPRGNKELAKALGMRRLRRHADLTGKDVMLVTRNGGLRSRAREVGLASVGSLRGVDFERYGRSGLRVGSTIVPLPGIGIFLRLTAFLVAIAALGAVVLLYLPSATVTVYPKSTPVTDTEALTLNADTAAVNKAGGEVPAHLRKQFVQASVPFPVSGQTTVKAPDGSDKTVPAATDDDIKRATDFAQQVLLARGSEQLRQSNKNETFFPDSAGISAYEGTPNVKAGEATPILQINASGQFSILSADNDALRAVLEEKQKAKLGTGQMWLAETFSASPISSGDFDKANNRMPVQVKLSEGTTAAFSVKKLRQALAGKSKRDAQLAVLERVDQDRPATITLTPGWAPWLPRFTSRIDAQVAKPAQNTGAGKPGATPTPSPTPAPQ